MAAGEGFERLMPFGANLFVPHLARRLRGNRTPRALCRQLRCLGRERMAIVRVRIRVYHTAKKEKLPAEAESFLSMGCKKRYFCCFAYEFEPSQNDISLRDMIYGWCRMIYLLRKYDIISVPAYAKRISSHDSAISYRRYITRSARNGYH